MDKVICIWIHTRVQRSNHNDTKKSDQKRPRGSCSEADSSSSFGWLVAWLAGSAGSASSSGSSSNSQNSQTGASPSSPAAVYIGNNHVATPMVSSRRYDSSNNGLYTFHTSNCGYLLWLPSIFLPFTPMLLSLFHSTVAIYLLQNSAICRWNFSCDLPREECSF